MSGVEIFAKLHERLAEMRKLAGQLAVALEAEVDLAYGTRHDVKHVHRQTGDALHAARRAGLLEE